MGKTKILIVEDETAMLTALLDKFSNEDFKVFGAENGEEGLKEALEKHPDIILLDIVMPKMDGMEMVKKLREDKWGAEVPVIFLTNLSDAVNVAEASKYGVYNYLVKTDWKLEDIVNQVREKLKEVPVEEE